MPRQTLPELIRWRARVSPDAPVSWFEGRETSYAELDRRSNQVANALIDAGVRPGDPVCLFDQNSDTFMEILFGVAKARAVFVPLNWRLAAPEVQFITADAGAKVFVAGSRFVEMVEGLRRNLPSVSRFIRLADEGSPLTAATPDETAWEDFAAFREMGSSLDPALDVDEADRVLQLYTSGTTGNPKGTQITTANLFPQYLGSPLWYGTGDEGDRCLVSMPQYHAFVLLYCIAAVVSGGTLVVTREFIPDEVLLTIQEQRIEHALLVPTTVAFLLRAAAGMEVDLTSLRSIVYGASAMPEAVVRAAMEYFGCDFIQLYGLTETSGPATRLSPQDHRTAVTSAPERLLSCGRPLFGFDVRVADARGEECPAGGMGEILIRSQLVTKGYWGLPEANAQSIRDGWFHTGDAGHRDEDGFLYIKDRIKDMIVSGGENIYPAEVEQTLARHPAVADCAVIGVPDEKWGETVKAVVVLKPGQEATPEELMEFCKGKIANFKRPRSVDFVAQLPRNSTGKVLKRELRRPYVEAAGRTV